MKKWSGDHCFKALCAIDVSQSWCDLANLYEDQGGWLGISEWQASSGWCFQKTGH
jgi:hypothetical protein